MDSTVLNFILWFTGERPLRSLCTVYFGVDFAASLFEFIKLNVDTCMLDECHVLHLIQRSILDKTCSQHCVQ